MSRDTMAISVEDFYGTVHAMLEGQLQETEAQVTVQAYEAADDAAEDLRRAVGKWSQTEDLPERERLLYEKGWKAYKHRPRDGHVEAVVANATAPGLTHLIEKGHELFVYGRDTGRRTKPRPHIAEAYERAAKKHFGGD